MSKELAQSASEQAFVAELDELTFNMAIMSRSPYDVATHFFPDQVAAAQEHLEEHAGKLVMGEISTNSYYVTADRARPTYSRAGLKFNRNDIYDFAGILLDLQDIDVVMPKIRSSFVREEDIPETGKILCMELAPLGSRVAAEGLRGFFRARVQHPFAIEEHAGESIWVPLRPLREKRLRFPKDAEIGVIRGKSE